MSGRRLLAVFFVLLVVSMAVLVPLRLLLAVPGLPAPGWSARAVDGSAWRGTLRGLQWGGLRLDTVRVALEPLPLALGERRWAIDAPALSATWLQGRTQGLDDAVGEIAIDLPGLEAPARLGFEQTRIVFRDGRCAEAGGRMRVELPFPGPPGSDGETAADGLRLDGPIECDGARGLAVLQALSAALPPGIDAVECRLHVDAHGGVAIDTTAATEVPAARLALEGAGFEAGPGGMHRRDLLQAPH
ncbi:type II secretion system protein N [Marilutibacter spongiae]|uniref:Type II secretion system protein N n=1 Tax=Marilutibacter spongiae TaxID=2025720 RepID=A0A7W3TM80_9GAMM|nr:type II secretion system protein N [Lysobacter spongiae]MBB1060925.1 type II secretion system protein N [Lysobacter spongiae]